MDLQGRLTLVLVLALVMAAVGVTAWRWPALSGRGPKWWAARLAVLVACQLLAGLAVAVAVNDYFDFYSNWTDILG